MSQAQKDTKRQAEKLLKIIQANPLQYPPDYEFLKGDMKALISRRINKQNPLVYEIFERDELVKIYRMWSHYD